MNEFRGKTALVTGASGGIGLEFARQLANAGTNLILVARSTEKLEEAARTFRERSVETTILTADLSRTESANRLYQEVSSRNLFVDILINNAGFGDYGEFSRSDLGKQVDMIQLNVSSLVSLTHLFLPEMISRKYGRILNVASTAAFQPGPFASVYYATKAAVLSFSQAIGNELEGTGVNVTALCPGPVDTGFQAAAGMRKSRRMRTVLLQPVEKVAQEGLAGLIHSKSVVIPGVMNRLVVTGSRFLPRSVVIGAARSYQTITD